MQTKRCGSCKAVKPLTEFNKDKARYDGVQYHCRSCQAEAKYKHRYGISRSEYDKLLSAQEFRCAICGVHCEDATLYYGKLVVDHNHNTGEIHGLLCDSCNWLLGHSKEDVGILRKAIEYLER